MLPAIKVGSGSIYKRIVIIYSKMRLQSYLRRYFWKIYIANNNRTTKLLQSVLEARIERNLYWLFFYRLRGREVDLKP